MATMTKTIEDFVKERNEAERTFVQQMQEQGQTLLAEKMKDLMDSCPEVASLTWRGYTPYFNDGDECVYGVYEPVFYFTREFYEGLVGKTYEKTDYDNPEKVPGTNWRGEACMVNKYHKITVTMEDVDDVEEYLVKFYLVEGAWPSVDEQDGRIAELVGEDSPLMKKLREVSNFIVDMGEANKLIFGDHAEISYSRGDDSFDVCEYSHD